MEGTGWVFRWWGQRARRLSGQVGRARGGRGGRTPSGDGELADAKPGGVLLFSISQHKTVKDRWSGTTRKLVCGAEKRRQQGQAGVFWL